MSGAAIRLVDCAKTFADGTRALEPLSLEIASGETLVMLGPSGCGKTTALRIIAGLERPDGEGRVLFDGEDVTRQPIEERNVGMVFQSYALFPNMTVAENVGYGLRVRRMPAAQRKARVGALLEMMRMTELGERRIDQLSGGQRQRVALARAVAVQPRALLLDEPLTALDAKLRDHLRIELDGLLRSLRITAIYVTHDQAEAMALGDRIVVMSKGRVAQVGTPREIYRQPTNRFVAEFIGTMNRLAGTAGDGRFRCKGGSIVLPADRDRQRFGPLELMFRPADVELVDDGTDALRGRVVSSMFLGDRTRLVVEGIGEENVIVEANTRREIAVGSEVALRIDPEGLVQL